MRNLKLVKDREEGKIKLIDENENVLLSLGFFADEFVYIFNTHNPIIITEDINSVFYSNLQEIMNNEYEFSTELSSKTDKEIIWLSDQYGDLEDKSVTDKINRLVIRKEDDVFIISHKNPYFVKNNIKRSSEIIAFSPGGNGIYSRNLITGSTFQNDIVNMYFNIMNSIPYKYELNKN